MIRERKIFCLQQSIASTYIAQELTSAMNLGRDFSQMSHNLDFFFIFLNMKLKCFKKLNNPLDVCIDLIDQVIIK